MPSSYCHIAMHIVFSTRNRMRWLKGDLKTEMHHYMIGIISNLNGTSIQIGGTEDHVHILCLMPKDLSLVEFMTKLKANSSKWFRQHSKLYFHWQDGYAAFSVSKSQIPSLVTYIKGQEEHHKHHSCEAEFEALLQKHLKVSP